LGVGCVVWGPGPKPQTPNPQSPIPNPQSPILYKLMIIFKFINDLKKNKI